jgi:hypothetical protein
MTELVAPKSHQSIICWECLMICWVTCSIATFYDLINANHCLIKLILRTFWTVSVVLNLMSKSSVAQPNSIDFWASIFLFDLFSASHQNRFCRGISKKFFKRLQILRYSKWPIVIRRSQSSLNSLTIVTFQTSLPIILFSVPITAISLKLWWDQIQMTGNTGQVFCIGTTCWVQPTGCCKSPIRFEKRVYLRQPALNLL